MSIVGYLKAVSDDENFRELIGEIRTLGFDLPIRLIANNERTSENSPSHLIFARGRSNREIRVGSAWKKTAQSGRRIGEEFLSLTLDDPSLPHPLNVAAFKDNDPWMWTIVWRRRQDAGTSLNASE